MKVTSFEAIVENGQIQLPVSVRLPEKAKVYVIVPDVEVRAAAVIASPRLAHAEQAAEFRKEVVQEREGTGRTQ